MPPDEWRIYKEIDRILWEEWDPIGINDVASRDEYQHYVPLIYQLKRRGATIEEIANALNDIVQNRMGLSSNIEACRLIAIKIKSV